MQISGLSSISFVFFVCFVNLSHQFDDTKFLPTEMYSRMRTVSCFVSILKNEIRFRRISIYVDPFF